MTLAILLCLALLLPATAFAQAALPSGDDPLALVQMFVQAAQAKNWLLLVPLALVGLIWAARRFGGKAWPFLLTDRGGALLSLLAAVAAALYAAVTAQGSAGVVQVLVAAGATLVSNQVVFVYLKKLLQVTGEDRAQEVEAKAGAALGPSAGANVNEAVK
jgi:hypothetical protein